MQIVFCKVFALTTPLSVVTYHYASSLVSSLAKLFLQTAQVTWIARPAKFGQADLGERPIARLSPDLG